MFSPFGYYQGANGPRHTAYDVGAREIESAEDLGLKGFGSLWFLLHDYPLCPTPTVLVRSKLQLLSWRFTHCAVVARCATQAFAGVPIRKVVCNHAGRLFPGLTQSVS